MNWAKMWAALRDRVLLAECRHEPVSVYTIMAWMETIEMSEPDAEL